MAENRDGQTTVEELKKEIEKLSKELISIKKRMREAERLVRSHDSQLSFMRRQKRF